MTNILSALDTPKDIIFLFSPIELFMEQINDTNHYSLVLNNNPQIDGSERKIIANIFKYQNFNVKFFF